MKLRLATTSCALLSLLAAQVGQVTAAEPPAKTQSATLNPSLSATETPAPKSLLVGLRRSSYGLRKQNADAAWWVDRAVRFATNFPGAQPPILQIVSNYQDDGSTEIEFPKPDSYQGSTTNMTFRRGGKLNHQHALAAYDAAGVKAILQFEPGDADVAACFELVYQAFRHHPCVIGLTIDAEWFRTRHSSDQTGLPVPDADAQCWMEQILRFNPSWLLVLKHFEAKHLPARFRHPNLWLLTDSQEFASQTEWMTDMREWAAVFKGPPVGAQFGYAKDQKWWAKTPCRQLISGGRYCMNYPITGCFSGWTSQPIASSSGTISACYMRPGPVLRLQDPGRADNLRRRVSDSCLCRQFGHFGGFLLWRCAP